MVGTATGEITSTADKVRENRLRRWAKRLGYSVHKDRARSWSIDNLGGYRLVYVYTNTIEAGEKFNLSLDDVENLLGGIEDRQRELDEAWRRDPEGMRAASGHAIDQLLAKQKEIADRLAARVNEESPR